MKAFEVATVNKMDPNDYILYQISKSKKYDMELLEDEAVERGLKRGMEKGMEKGVEKGVEKTEISYVLTIHAKGYSPIQISDLLTMPIARVIEIIEKYGDLK